MTWSGCKENSLDGNGCKATTGNFKVLDSQNGSNAYAKKLIRLTAARIKVILKHPEDYKTTIYPETRISAMGHFSILYKLTENKFIITAFWDNRQDSERLLEIIKP